MSNTSMLAAMSNATADCNRGQSESATPKRCRAYGCAGDHPKETDPRPLNETGCNRIPLSATTSPMLVVASRTRQSAWRPHRPRSRPSNEDLRHLRQEGDQLEARPARTSADGCLRGMLPGFPSAAVANGKAAD